MKYSRIFLSLLLVGILIPWFSPSPAHAQSGSRKVVHLSIDSVVLDDLKEDGLFADFKDEVLVVYSIQEVTGQGVWVDDNVRATVWGPESHAQYDRITSFEPLALEIAQDSGVRVEIAVYESNGPISQFQEALNSACGSSAGEIALDAASGGAIGLAAGATCLVSIFSQHGDVPFTGPPAPATYNSAQLANGVRQTQDYTWQSEFGVGDTRANYATYTLSYSLRSEPLAGSSTQALPWSVVDRDGFDGTAVSGKWWFYDPSRKLPIGGGTLQMTGRNDWLTGMGSTVTVGENQGILVLFRYQSGTMAVHLDQGDWNTALYKRWGFESNVDGDPQTWGAYTLYGAQGAQGDHYQSAPLRPDTWYYLLLRIGEDGRFYTAVWERDDPSTYVINYDTLPGDKTWGGSGWFTILESYSGTLEVEEVQWLQFESSDPLPATPPQVSG